MSIEHFIQGAGADHIHLLGESAPLGRNQAKPLYKAERQWRQSGPDGGGKTISTRAARDLVGEAINHPGMDEVPGIAGLRAGYDPKRDVRFARSVSTKDAEGNLTPVGGLVNSATGGMALKVNPENQVRLGAVTHEAAHKILLSDKQFAGTDHNWPMARLHVHIARQLLGGKHAYALKNYYEGQGVNFGKKII